MMLFLKSLVVGVEKWKITNGVKMFIWLLSFDGGFLTEFSNEFMNGESLIDINNIFLNDNDDNHNDNH